MESTGLFALLLVPIISLDIKIFQKADNVWISLLDFLTFQSCKQFSHSGHGIGCSVEKYPLFIAYWFASIEMSAASTAFAVVSADSAL